MLLLNSGYSGPALSHQAAVVGPLSNVEITARSITTPDQSLEGPKNAVESSDLLTAGTFELSLTGVADDEWIVVSASGGSDIDHDGDGSIDPSATINTGTLHSVAKASDWRNKHLRITPLTELAYRYSEHLFAQIPQEELSIRLQDIARYLIKTDIDGSGTIDWYDILAFDPANPFHRDKLKTSYDWLSDQNEAGDSIVASLLADDVEKMLSRMDELYSYLMTRFPVPDSRYHSAKVTLSVFGSGSASSDAPANLVVDSTLAEPIHEDHIFLPENETTIVSFTATPAPDTQILSWSGCETVSADLSQCSVSLNQSRFVIANFGRTTEELTSAVHDLSRTYNILGMNTISILIPDDMADMIAEMAAAAIDEFIVGDDGGGFLRRITAINQISSTYYQLDTADANLDEVIQEGTGQLFKQMTNGDLEGYVAPAQSGASAKVAAIAFTGAKDVKLQVSNDPEDTTFTLVLGNGNSSAVETKSFIEESATVELYDDGEGHTLTATGTISLDISIDTGVDYKWSPIGGAELQAFKFITILDAEQTVELTANAELAQVDFVSVKIGSFHFTPIVFAIGVVPVWVSPIVDVYFFAEGKVEAELTFGVSFSQSVEGGVLYNKNTGFSIHKKFSSDHTFLPPIGAIKASIKGGIEARPVLKIYDATGPAIPQQVYAKMTASVSTEIFGTCSDIVLKNSIGFESAFLWDMSGTTKFGQMLHLDQLEEMTRFNIVDFEIPLNSAVLYNNCPAYVAGSHLHVDGDGLFSTIDVGDPNGLLTSLTVNNSGDETLNWNTSFVPSEVIISPSFGELAPGEQEVVQMSLATASLSAGRYLKKPYFYNEASVGSALPDEQFGNTRKTIDVTVLGEITDTPVIVSATSTNVGVVTLDWDFSSSGNDPFVGFQIFTSLTPENLSSFQHIYTTHISDRTVTFTGFTPALTYSFDMRAFSNSGAQPGPYSNKVPVTIFGNPPAIVPTALNDTGIIWSGNYDDGNNTTCVASELPDGSNVHTAQDCSHGRDVSHNDDSDGHAGFSFTKLDGNGVPLSNQSAEYASNPWACVKDNVTGLTWEVKTNDNGLHDRDDSYNWYNTDPASNGGADGYADDDGNICYGYDSGDSSSFCNTQAYVARVNAAGWCGGIGWRMPTREELRSIVSYDRYNPSIDTDYFPNATSSYVWSGFPNANSTNSAWVVHFYNGNSYDYNRVSNRQVRLVRSGQ